MMNDGLVKRFPVSITYRDACLFTRSATGRHAQRASDASSGGRRSVSWYPNQRRQYETGWCMQ